MRAQAMIATHPQAGAVSGDALARCIEACFDCAQVCTACADACLAEAHVQDLRHCIRLNLDCADICATAGRMASRLTAPADQLLRLTLDACALACRLCGEECQGHAGMHEHCRVCAEACRACVDACATAVRMLESRKAA